MHETYVWVSISYGDAGNKGHAKDINHHSIALLQNMEPVKVVGS